MREKIFNFCAKHMITQQKLLIKEEVMLKTAIAEYIIQGYFGCSSQTQIEFEYVYYIKIKKNFKSMI